MANSKNPASGGDDRESAAAWRRPAAAFLVGAAMFVGGATLFLGEYAGARGAFTPPMQLEGAVSTEPSASRDDSAPVRHTHRVASSGRGRAVCVRLCDGFFFPSVVSSGGDEACASQCPDAPTALYYEPAGSDTIENAVSLSGASYSALPVANRSQTSFDETCSCHKSYTRSYMADLMRDRTLRNGDIVMTDSGFTVFRSGKSSAISPSSFVALAQAAGVSKGLRADLGAMEHAGVWDRQSGAYSSSSPASGSDTASAAARSHKGIVTVDDGDSPR